MKIKAIFTPSISTEIVDLTEYGYDELVTWESLLEEEQNEIRDSLAEQILIITAVQSLGE